MPDEETTVVRSVLVRFGWSGVEESMKSSGRGQVSCEIAAICVANPSQLFLRASG